MLAILEISIRNMLSFCLQAHQESFNMRWMVLTREQQAQNKKILS